MSKSNYKRLGDYIREVNVRNRDLAVTRLVGLSMSKEFRTSTSNIIGTDLSNYKIVKSRQFSCDFMSPIRVYKLPVVLSKENDEVIVSPAYCVFEVVDTNKLLPEYLMMWFRRSEFDRYVYFKCDSAIRGGYGWDELCDTTLPIPDIAEQQRIVAEYEALSRRIAINEQICTKLEETAAALYRKMFVDNIDKENLPDGWRMGKLTDIAEYTNGLACQNYEAIGDEYLPVIKIRELSQGHIDNYSDKVVTDVPKKLVINYGDVIFSWSASLMIDFWCDKKGVLNQHLFKVTSDSYKKWFYYLWTKNHIDEWKRLISAKATSMGHIKREDLESAQVVIPPQNELNNMDKQMSPLFSSNIHKRRENLILKELQTLLLSKLATN